MNAVTGEHRVDSRGAICASRVFPDSFDALGQRSIGQRPRRNRATGPLVVRRYRFANGAKQRLNPECRFVLVNEAHDHRRAGSASWAKNALASFRISFVRLSSAFSLRKRLISADSSVVGRSERTPRSASS